MWCLVTSTQYNTTQVNKTLRLQHSYLDDPWGYTNRSKPAWSWLSTFIIRNIYCINFIVCVGIRRPWCDAILSMVRLYVMMCNFSGFMTSISLDKEQWKVSWFRLEDSCPYIVYVCTVIQTALGNLNNHIMVQSLPIETWLPQVAQQLINRVRKVNCFWLAGCLPAVCVCVYAYTTNNIYLSVCMCVCGWDTHACNHPTILPSHQNIRYRNFT